MKLKKKTPRNQKHNFGFGKMLLFAFKMALDALFGVHDHYGTRRSHKIRIRIFAKFCRRNNIRDARAIDRALIAAYGEYLRVRLNAPYVWPDGHKDRPISVAYAHNLISTVNTTMYAMRKNEELHLSARAALGVARSYIRKTQIEADIADAKTAADRMIAADMLRGAAVVLLTRAWGMRVQEAILQDLDRMKREVDKTGSAAILEGCKGGRVCLTRTIKAEEFQIEALEFALAVRPHGSTCLLSKTDSVISFYRTTLNRCSRILRKCGPPSFRELRAGFAQDVYESIVRGPSPLRGPIRDRALDRIAREEVARMLGHDRYQVASSYIGGY
jgi:hypothetical protein